MLEEILLGSGFAFAAAVQPGPLQAYLIAQTLANGFRRTIPATFAPVLSDVPIAILVLFVLTNIPPGFVLVLQFLGGSFLLYLAFEAYRTFRGDQQTASRLPTSVRQTFFKAVLVNVLNPNAYIGWTFVMGPLVARAWQESPLNSLALIAAFYATMVATSILILALFGRARVAGPKLSRVLIGLSVLALAAFGLYQIWNGGTALLHVFT